MHLRKPRPDTLTRAEVETMIAEAVAAERARSEAAMAAVVLALNGVAEGVGGMVDTLCEMAWAVGRHEDFVERLSGAVHQPTTPAAN